MKRIFLIALALIVSACSKSDDSSDNSATIFGKWELYSATEGGYDEFDGYVGRLPTSEFISPSTFRLSGYSEDNSVTPSYNEIGNFTLVGDILTLNTTSKNGESYSDLMIYTEVAITDNSLNFSETYDDGYDSGYITYHLRRID
ncbi:MAG: hypothetical protein JJE44_04490 [Flavobacteriaceae bacterium]|nr:hypothetical protein [Flavobacteriaceae bacterium]